MTGKDLLGPLLLLSGQVPEQLRIVYIVLGLFFAQVMFAIPQLSLTADEPVHMAQGYVYWTRGDFRFAEAVAQPPLPDFLPGLGLLLQPGPAPEMLEGWAEVDHARFVRASLHWYGPGPALEAATFVSRFPSALVALIGAAFVYRWARERYGGKAGLLALALFAFDPNILAHSGLATTDLLLTVWGFIAVYAATSWIGQNHRRWGFLSGLAAGFALASKTSGFFPLGIIGLLLLIDTWEKRRPWVELLKAFIFVTGIAFGILWAFYRFEYRPFPLATHWLLWSALHRHISEGHISYLMGHTGHRGWWYYYPIVFLLKTPLPTLILIGAALAKICRSPRRWWPERDLWLYPLLYGTFTLLSTIAIGYRYLLPVLPFLFVLTAAIAKPRSGDGIRRTNDKRATSRRGFAPQALGVILYAWLILRSLQIAPHYLTFFNELAGGPYRGHRYLVDSNLDWGQSFKALRRWLENHPPLPNEPLYGSFYTYADPTLYGVSFQSLAPAPEASPFLPSRFNPPPGLYILSATTLQGVMVTDPDTYDWFRHQEPIARPGIALFVYRVAPTDPPPTWLAQCTVPLAPLTPEAAADGFGRNDLRMVYFDCTQAWIYPTGGQASGWYALFRGTARQGDNFISRNLIGARLSYEQRRPGALPPFVIYEQPARVVGPRFAPQPAIRLGALTFIGFYLTFPPPPEPGDTVEIETYWRVETVPDRPLSIMMHFVGPGGTPLLVSDGLGVPVDQWQPGDIIIQRHRLSLPPDAPHGEYQPITGVYWLDTMERWPVEINGEPAGDQLPIGPIPVGK
mgnify:FL=1